MDGNIETARRLYDAMHHLDVASLRASVDTDFIGRVSEGMPGGYGGVYRSADAMIEEVWLPVFAKFGALPFPDELLLAVDGRVVVTGEYRGRAPASGERFAAGFAHVLTVSEGQVTELCQTTDTRSWPDARDVDGAAG